MNKFEFACSFWGYDNIINKKIDNKLIEEKFEEWKFSMESFKSWKVNQKKGI